MIRYEDFCEACKVGEGYGGAFVRASGKLTRVVEGYGGAAVMASGQPRRPSLAPVRVPGKLTRSVEDY